MALTLALLSLAGIPPLAGFAGKVLLLGAAIDGGMAWLAVIAAINMAVALFYYVRVSPRCISRRTGAPRWPHQASVTCCQPLSRPRARSRSAFCRRSAWARSVSAQSLLR
jgi:formate hydrogenlyase subunit 3/multisubunit Na+/H+ antiporter MnhD subunit